MWRISLLLCVITVIFDGTLAFVVPSARNLQLGKLYRGKLNVLKMADEPVPGGQDIDWKNLQFGFMKTRSFAKVEFKDGKWGKTELMRGEPYIPMHIASTALHYGQACFEGLKAFTGKDGKVRVFRPDENAKRMEQSCKRVCMEYLPHDHFVQAVKDVVRDNIDYVPPYGTGGSMYVRPLLFGSGGAIGLKPSPEYTLIILVLPAGDYYKGGVQQVPATVIEDYDRAAPNGVGNVKVAGNYGADLLPNMQAKERGFPVALYLDAKTNSYIEEFSTSNFIGVDKKGTFITPKSNAILSSVTNRSLMQLAEKNGIEVQHRPVKIDEVSEMDEVVACGTAVVMTPIGSLHYKGKNIEISDRNGFGPVMQGLYDELRGIQYGDLPDTFNWMQDV